MPACISRVGLAKAEDILIKFGCLLQIINLDRDVNDARHVFLRSSKVGIDAGGRYLDPGVNTRTSHSINSSARNRIEVGSSMPISLAVLRLTTSSNFVGCSTGRSAGLAPLNILST